MTPNEKTEFQDEQTTELVKESQGIHTQDQTTRNTDERTLLKQRTTQDDASLKERTPQDDASLKERTTQDDASLKERTTQDDASLKERTTQDDASLKERTTQDDASLKERTPQDDASLKERTIQDDASLKQTMSDTDVVSDTDDMVGDAIDKLANIELSTSVTGENDGIGLKSDEDDSDRDQDSLAETFLESDGNSLGCESDLDSDGLSDNDHVQQRRYRPTEQGEGGPERRRVTSRRHQPYRTPSRSPQDDSSLGSGGSTAHLSPQMDEFLHNLVSGNPTGCEDDSQSGTCFRGDSSSDSDDVIKGVANTFGAPSGADGVQLGLDEGSLICDSYQRTIPSVVEEKEKEPDEPEKKPRRKRVQKKKTVQKESPATISRPNPDDELMIALQLIQDDLADSLTVREENQIAVSNASDVQNCYTHSSHFASSASSVHQQTTLAPTSCSGSHVTTQQTMCHMPQASNFINPTSAALNPGTTPYATLSAQASTNFNPPATQSGSVAMTLPPNFPPFRLTTAGTTGVPTQQFLACTLLPLHPTPQSVVVNLPQLHNHCQSLPPSSELIYSRNISQLPHSVNNGLPILLPKPT